tara:strand:+ start:1535 stop:1891 length:357 start_codon:yes stop_codon:yes gene_type:complete
MSLETNIKKWVALDNNIKQLNEQIKKLKDEKMSYNKDILEYVSNNNLDNATIKINNGTLKFVNSNSSQVLTYTFLLDCLKKFINNDDKAMEIIKFIKSQREIKTVKEIKRYYTLNKSD